MVILPRSNNERSSILALEAIFRICGIAAYKFGDEAANVTLWWINPG
jgi:hypothetical protein